MMRSWIRKRETSENDDCDDCVSTMGLEDFNQKLSDLRLLGHFYGHLVFSCYLNSADKPGTLHLTCEEEEKLPHMVESVCDFALASLKSAIRTGHVLPTITWMVQTLSFVPRNAAWLNQGSLHQCFLLMIRLPACLRSVRSKYKFTQVTELYSI